MAWATVSGSCSSLDNAAVAADYKAEDSIYFDTVNASGTTFLPTGKLAVGFYKQTRLAGSGGDGYTMKRWICPQELAAAGSSIPIRPRCAKSGQQGQARHRRQ